MAGSSLLGPGFNLLIKEFMLPFEQPGGRVRVEVEYFSPSLGLTEKHDLLMDARIIGGCN